MSENKIQNEEELWNVLDGTAPAAPKTDVKTEAKPAKTEAKFAKPGNKGKVDTFFLSCMAGVAAVSVAATLLITTLVGGEPAKPGYTPQETKPGISGETIPAGNGEINPGVSVDDTTDDLIAALEQENAELRAQVEAQKEQVLRLQAQVLDLSGGEEMPTISTEPGVDNEEINAQVEAYEVFNQIKEAYIEFDLDLIEQLIPEMDKRVMYLSNDALLEYYTILEYVEMPSNG